MPAAPRLKLRTYRCGDPPKRGEGLRIGAARRPPRGVAKKDWTKRHYFDVWFPVVAPSESLLKHAHQMLAEDPEKFFAAYEREVLGHAESRQAIELLADIAKRTAISVGCYCEDETRCHRSRLRELIERAARE